MIFKETDTVIINKVDLLPYCEFDMSQFQQLVEELNPDVKIFEVSCTDGNGIEEWSEWLSGAIDRVR
jgi:hydrogenase nickel incorporation protein HypB